MTIKTQEHYGKRVWTNVEMDELRKDGCLCFNCAKLRDERGPCAASLVLLTVCEYFNMATMVTRCKRFKKEKRRK